MSDIIPNSACLITVRTASDRLPQKCLQKIKGKAVIEHIIDRAKLVAKAEKIVLCTSDHKEDDVLEEFAKKHGILWFRGSFEDQVARWYGALEKHQLDFFANIGADNLFFDPSLMDQGLQRMTDNPEIDIIEHPQDLNAATFLHVIRTKVLKKICETKTTTETGVYFSFFEDPELNPNIKQMAIPHKTHFNNNIRLTLDYPEDLEFFNKVFEELKIETNNIPTKDIIEFLQTRPDLVKINFFRHQQYKQNQQKIIQETKTDIEATKKNS